MSSRTCAARRAMAVLGTVVAVALATACDDDGEAGPTGPSGVNAQPTTSTSANGGAEMDGAGSSRVGQPDTSGAGANDLDLPDGEGRVRNARSDAMIAKPVILDVARTTLGLAVQFAVSMKTDINDYRVQWSPGCIASWSRKIGGDSLIHSHWEEMLSWLQSRQPGETSSTERSSSACGPEWQRTPRHIGRADHGATSRFSTPETRARGRRHERHLRRGRANGDGSRIVLLREHRRCGRNAGDRQQPQSEAAPWRRQCASDRQPRVWCERQHRRVSGRGAHVTRRVGDREPRPGMARLLLGNRPGRVTWGTPAIGAGSSARTVKVSVINNEHDEGSERFTLMQGRFLKQGQLNLQLGVDAQRG